MEPAEASLKYIIPNVLVERVEERFMSRYDHGIGKDASFTKISLGWFVVLQGSHEALSVGKERPDLLQGHRVQITIEKVRNA